MPLRSEKVEFPGSSGGALAARLDLPEGPPGAYALFAHCFTCSKDIFAAQRIAAGLAERGVGVLRFDFTGLGHSQGEFANSNFSSNVEDLLRAAAYLRERRAAPGLLIVHSLGGAAVLAAAGEIPEAKAVVTIGAPAEPSHVLKHLGARRAEIEAQGEAEVELGGRRFRIRRQLIEDIEAHSLEERIARLNRALLVLHAPRDEIVGIENASKIFLAARHPKSFVSLDDADHLLTKRSDAAYVAELIAAWGSRYLGLSAGTAALASAGGAPVAEAREGEVLVSSEGAGRLTQKIAAGPHLLTADEPIEQGGAGSGPTPYDLLLAALGACTSMTLRLYADRKGWPLAAVSVRLRHEKVHAQDCKDCETKVGRIDQIERALHLEGPLSEEQKTKLLEIADKCPVHRTLESEIKIRTALQ